jgi:hypothetical protein
MADQGDKERLVGLTWLKDDTYMSEGLGQNPLGLPIYTLKY